MLVTETQSETLGADCMLTDDQPDDFATAEQMCPESLCQRGYLPEKTEIGLL